MPRKARTDAPGALHHIIVREIERRRIFSDDQDRDNFLERLGGYRHRDVNLLFCLRSVSNLHCTDAVGNTYLFAANKYA